MYIRWPVPSWYVSFVDQIVTAQSIPVNIVNFKKYYVQAGKWYDGRYVYNRWL